MIAKTKSRYEMVTDTFNWIAFSCCSGRWLFIDKSGEFTRNLDSTRGGREDFEL
jgi:hypothetical protein